MNFIFMREFSEFEVIEIRRLLDSIQELSVFRDLPDHERITLDYGDRVLEIEKTEEGTRVYGYGRAL